MKLSCASIRKVLTYINSHIYNSPLITIYRSSQGTFYGHSFPTHAH